MDNPIVRLIKEGAKMSKIKIFFFLLFSDSRPHSPLRCSPLPRPTPAPTDNPQPTVLHHGSFVHVPWPDPSPSSSSSSRFYLFIFRERGREGEREGEKHPCVVAPVVHPLLGTWPATQARADWESNHNRLVCSQVLHPLSHNPLLLNSDFKVQEYYVP